MRRREEIRAAPDDVERAVQEARYALVEKPLAEARLIGDAVVAAFFAGAKSREREAHRRKLEDAAMRSPEAARTAMREIAPTLRHGAHPVQPFHWGLEFPEVFTGDDPGFDAVVGNPPFAGKNTLIAGHREHYLVWLQTVHEGAHGNSDLVAHFFRRAFGLLKRGGCLGLIATNTIGQGDTRESSLRWVLEHGGAIVRAIRRYEWPGEAAVVVSVVHVVNDVARSPVLDGRQVRRISAYLVEGDLDASPRQLVANAGKAFVGCYLLGLGFTFDDEAAAKGKATPVAEMRRLITKNPRTADRISPYLGGEEMNTDPRHAHRRWVIDFNDFPLRRERMAKSWTAMIDRARASCRARGTVPDDYPDPVAEDWPDLLEIVLKLVKPERDTGNRTIRRERWWQFAERAPALRAAIEGLERVIVRSLTSAHFPTLSFLPSGMVYDQTLIVFPSCSFSFFASNASRIHEAWVSSFGATLEDRGRYNIKDCFETFPFSIGFETNQTLEAAGKTYHDHRASLMVLQNEGLTKPTIASTTRASIEPTSSTCATYITQWMWPSCGPMVGTTSRTKRNPNF
jgi:hypothetical protein